MTDRRQKIEELMERFHSLKRCMAFRPMCSEKMPPVTPSQWSVLLTVGQREESTVKEVAEALGISSSAATQLIDGLVASGYVERKAHAEDRRKVTLTLSRKTKNQVEKIKKQSIEQFLGLFEALNDKELDQYMELNKKIVDRATR